MTWTAVEIMNTTGEGPDTFLVEAIDDDGGVERAEFHGRLAAEHARLWAKTAYAYEGAPIGKAVPMYPPRARPTLTVVRSTPTQDQQHDD